MKTRTCPNCNYKYSLGEYLKKPFFRGIFLTWNCLNCGAKLGIYENRRWLLSFLGVVPAVALPYIAGWFANQGLSITQGYFISIVLLVLYEILVFSFEKFQLSEKQESPG